MQYCSKWKRGIDTWESGAMRDFRTRLVCPECGESDNSELRRTPAFLPVHLLQDSVIRQCRDCHHYWWADWSPHPILGIL
jgi:hypothetical protein